MEQLAVYWYIFAGFIFGLAGQGTRVLVGIKKQYDSTEAGLSQWINKTQLLVSLLIGAIAGLFAGLFLSNDVMNTAFFLAVIAAGYAGADFIEGFMRTNAPKYTTDELTKAVENNPQVMEMIKEQE